MCLSRPWGRRRWFAETQQKRPLRFWKGFEKLRVPVNADKTKLLATDDQLNDGTNLQLRCQPLERASSARLLGTDINDGSCRRVRVTTKRSNTAVYKSNRLQILRRAGADTSSAQRAGPAARALWGSHVMGIPPPRLHTLRLSECHQG